MKKNKKILAFWLFAIFASSSLAFSLDLNVEDVIDEKTERLSESESSSIDGKGWFSGWFSPRIRTTVRTEVTSNVNSNNTNISDSYNTTNIGGNVEVGSGNTITGGITGGNYFIGGDYNNSFNSTGN